MRHVENPSERRRRWRRSKIRAQERAEVETDSYCCRPSWIHHPLCSGLPADTVRNKKPLGSSIRRRRERRPSCASFGLYVRGLAPYAVEPRLSRIRSRLGSTGPGHPLGSLDLSGQRHICRMDASPNEASTYDCTTGSHFVKLCSAKVWHGLRLRLEPMRDTWFDIDHRRGDEDFGRYRACGTTKSCNDAHEKRACWSGR
jgi:hypothetical protein